MPIHAVNGALGAYTATQNGTTAKAGAASQPTDTDSGVAKAAEEQRSQDVVELGQPRDESAKTDWNEILKQMDAKKAAMEVQTSKPKDPTSQLTALLVAAQGPFEVRQVIADAGKEMLSLQVTAATGNGEDAKLARAILKRLQRLIDRGYKKIDGLNSEEHLRLQQRRAEQNKQRQRASEIKEELRQRIKRRKNEERKWLDEDAHERLFGSKAGEAFNPYGDAQLDAAVEAQIASQAEAQAAVEIAAESGAAGGGAAAAGATAPAGGASAEGGGGDAAAPEGGGMDISV